jgi:hypothetical protein
MTTNMSAMAHSEPRGFETGGCGVGEAQKLLNLARLIGTLQQLWARLLFTDSRSNAHPSHPPSWVNACQ